MDNKLNTYHIGDIAQKLGVSSRSIRYYEEFGLLRPSRTDGGFRKYSEHDVNLIRMIVRFKDLGMTLEEIRTLLGKRNDDVDSNALRSLKSALAFRKKEFQDKIEKLKEGIEQIDLVLKQLNQCDQCGMTMEKEVCHICMKKSGDVSPLMGPLL
ncbi:MAG: MerR family transcriptional regulator [Pseudomonadota bacterium]